MNEKEVIQLEYHLIETQLRLKVLDTKHQWLITTKKSKTKQHMFSDGRKQPHLQNGQRYGS